MTTAMAMTNIVRNSRLPMVNTVERGRSTSHCGRESAVIVRALPKLISHVR